jgi:hypothetical protein
VRRHLGDGAVVHARRGSVERGGRRQSEVGSGASDTRGVGTFRAVGLRARH